MALGREEMKPYVRPMPGDWWLQRLPYLSFMAREVSSVFVAAYVVVFMVMLNRISQGPAAYQAFLEGLQSPLAIFFHVVALIFALIHTLSWFSLTPKAMMLHIGEDRVPSVLILGSHYLAWIAISAFVAWMILKS